MKAFFLALLLTWSVLMMQVARPCQAQGRTNADIRSGVKIKTAPQTPSGVKTTVPLPRDPYSPRVPVRAIAYQRAAYTLGFFGLAWSAAGLILLLRTRASARLRTGVYRALRLPVAPDHAPPFRATLVYYAIYSLLLTVWASPVGLARLALEHHYGFSRQGVGGYLSDVGLGWGLGLLAAPLYAGGYWLAARLQSRWWLVVWGLLIPLLTFEIVLQPVVIAPLFNRYTPLAPGPTRDHILTLANRAGIRGGRVFVEDTSRRTRHVNAYVTGVGPTTRIVLNDTALQTLPEDQLLAMMGHEMGHYVEGHLWVSLATSVLGAGVFLLLASRLLPWLTARFGRRAGVYGVLDLAALPLLSLLILAFLFAQSPIENALSRYQEHRADAFGLRLTHLNDPMARLFVRFAERDFSDPQPPALIQFWFGSHPPLADRIAFARAYRD